MAEMEKKTINIEVPAGAEIITIECFDGNGTFFAKSLGIIEMLEEAQNIAEMKEVVEEAKEELAEEETE